MFSLSIAWIPGMTPIPGNAPMIPYPVQALLPPFECVAIIYLASEYMSEESNMMLPSIPYPTHINNPSPSYNLRLRLHLICLPSSIVAF